jgi:hypothetical protein
MDQSHAMNQILFFLAIQGQSSKIFTYDKSKWTYIGDQIIDGLVLVHYYNQENSARCFLLSIKDKTEHGVFVLMPHLQFRNSASSFQQKHSKNTRVPRKFYCPFLVFPLYT